MAKKGVTTALPKAKLLQFNSKGKSIPDTRDSVERDCAWLRALVDESTWLLMRRTFLDDIQATYEAESATIDSRYAEVSALGRQ